MIMRTGGRQQRPEPEGHARKRSRGQLAPAREDRGFALLAVLWVVVALSALTAGAVTRARADGAMTGDRVTLMRGRWAAEGCLAVAQARIELALASHHVFASPPGDTLYYANNARCATESYDPATRLVRDSMPPAFLARFDSLVSSRQYATSISLDTLFTDYGNGRINVNGAPLVVVAALPGFNAEVVRVVSESRAWRRPFRNLDDLLGRLSPNARRIMIERYPELVTLTTFGTSAFVVTARGWVDGTRPVSSIEVVVVNAGTRAAIVSRRMW